MVTVTGWGVVPTYIIIHTDLNEFQIENAGDFWLLLSSKFNAFPFLLTLQASAMDASILNPPKSIKAWHWAQQTATAFLPENGNFSGSFCRSLCRNDVFKKKLVSKIVTQTIKTWMCGLWTKQTSAAWAETIQCRKAFNRDQRMLQLSIVIIHDRDLYSKVGKAAEFPTVSWRSSSLFFNPQSCWCLAQDSPLEGEILVAFLKRPHSHGLFIVETGQDCWNTQLVYCMIRHCCVLGQAATQTWSSDHAKLIGQSYVKTQGKPARKLHKGREMEKWWVFLKKLSFSKRGITMCLYFGACQWGNLEKLQIYNNITTTLSPRFKILAKFLWHVSSF